MARNLGGGTAGNRPSTGGNPSVSGAPPTPVRASDAVEGYLNALAAGNGKAALAYAAKPAKGVLASDKVLADSRKRAPMTAISVPVIEDQSASSVVATYKLGKSTVSASFPVVKVGDQWRLTQVAQTVDLTRVNGVPLRINGATVKGNTATLLPGAYTLSTGLPYIDYSSGRNVLLRTPDDFADFATPYPQVTKKGKNAFIGAAKKSYKSCLKSTREKPKGCPFTWTRKGYDFNDNGVRWRQQGADPFKAVVVRGDGASGQLSIPLRVKISGPCRFSGTSGTCTGIVSGLAVADTTLTKKKLQLDW